MTTKILCSICYKNKATEITNLYCENCLNILIEELNNIQINKPKNTKTTIETYHFKKPKK